MVDRDFGYTGPAGDKYPTNTESLGSVRSGRGPVGVDGTWIEGGFLHAAETLLLHLSNAAGLLTTLLERAVLDADRQFGQPHHGHADQGEQTEAKPQPPKNKGGRPKKDAAGNGAAPQTPAPPAGKSAEDDMFPTDGAGAAEDDPFAVPGEGTSAPPADAVMGEAEAKEALRSYMTAWGTEGTVRLSDLLNRVAGVKRYSDLPANKRRAVVEAAHKELAGRK